MEEIKLNGISSSEFLECKNCKQFYPVDYYVGKRFKGKTLVKKCIKCRVVDKNGWKRRNEEKINIIQNFLSQGCSVGKCPKDRKATECDHINKISLLKKF